MGSIIRSISFKNFYNFYGDYKDNIYHFGEGLNIVNADNGLGKSKILMAFFGLLNIKCMMLTPRLPLVQIQRH